MRNTLRFLCFAFRLRGVNSLDATERGPARRLFWRLYFIGWRTGGSA